MNEGAPLGGIDKRDLSCSTRYPILLVHGAFVRDNNALIKYWGRIPEVLEESGAEIYFSNHDAFGSIHDSALCIAAKIEDIISQEKRKVNIIAHSKGGLDCRYLISTLNLNGRIASLTTVCTPHHGSRVLDLLRFVPDGVFRFASRLIDLFFRVLGDSSPDFFVASRELSASVCRKFNRLNPDRQGVYYQSFGSAMLSAFDDMLFFFTYLLVRIFSGDNDGLVDVESMRWTNYREIKALYKGKGLSHADVIDFRKKERHGTDVPMLYKKIVIEMKERGL